MTEAAAGSASVDCVPHFLVVGSPRSGTTLVQRLATELPGVQVTAETHFFPFVFDSIVKSSEFPLDRGKIEHVLESYSRLPTTHGLQLDIKGIADALAGKCSDPWTLFRELVRRLAPEATIVGEKTPDHLRWWRPLHEACQQLKFVWVVRDPRAVVVSAMDAPFGMDSILLIAASWRSDINEMKSARKRLDSRQLLILQYESIVKEPAVAQARLAEFLGVTAKPVPIAERGLSLFQSWEAEWKERALAGIDPERSTAWRDRLNQNEVAIVEMVTGSLMCEFGYEPTLSRRQRLAGISRVSPFEFLKLARMTSTRVRRRRRIEASTIRCRHSERILT